MYLKRAAAARGKGDFAWLQTRYSFSFASYYDPHYMGFRALRVINEDEIAAGGGFPMHGHRDMEILTIVLAGTVEHHDSMGHVRQIKAGQAQCMSAGTGVQHSESNPSATEPLHLLQIWVEPAEVNLKPSYREADIPKGKDKLNLLAAPIGQSAPLELNQEARLYYGCLSAGRDLSLKLELERHVWVQMISGRMRLGSQELSTGDGMAVSREEILEFAAEDDCEFLVFELS